MLDFVGFGFKGGFEGDANGSSRSVSERSRCSMLGRLSFGGIMYD